MDRLRRWYRTTVFPGALKRTQVVIGGLVGFLVGIAAEFVKVGSPSHVPEWFVVTPGYVWGGVALVAMLLAALFIEDAARTRRLMILDSPRLEVVEAAACDDCNQLVGGDRKESIGLWNPSAADVHDVHVFVESLKMTSGPPSSGGDDVTEFTGKREIWGLGQSGQPLGTIRGSSRTGHIHVCLLSRFSAEIETNPSTGEVRVRIDVPPTESGTGKGQSYVLEVSGGFPLGWGEYIATLAVEAANMRPRVVEVRINSQVSPAITEVRCTK